MCLRTRLPSWLVLLTTCCLTLGASRAVAQPLVTSQSKVSSSAANPGGDRFGQSIAIEADNMVIGAPIAGTVMHHAGGAYVFTRNGGLFTQAQVLTANSDPPTDDDEFGTSVAISGDTIAVGARADDIGGTDSGSVWIFRFIGGSWTFEQKITASDRLGGDAFGTSVSLSGNTLIVGAPGDDANTNLLDCGAAYVFVRSGSVWSEQQKLVASDAEQAAAFGGSVSLSGDSAAIGASGAGANSGAAYAFVRSGTTWSQQQKLDNVSGRFGASVSIDGDEIIVGSPAAPNGGAARVFRLISGVWIVEDDITASDAAANDQFGSSVAIDGERLVISAPGDDHDAGAGGTNNSEGSAYAFVRSGTNWIQRSKLTATDAAGNDQGAGNNGDDKSRLVSISGTSIAMGAYLDNVNGPSSGSAYVFVLGSETPVFINEVDATGVGNPETTELIELFDGGIGNTSLDGLVVVLFNGLNDSAYSTIDLDGQTTDANGYFVIGGSGVPGASIVLGNDAIQNGADAVALYAWNSSDFNGGRPVTTTNLVDAIVYGTGQGDDAGLLALLNAGQPQVNEAGGGDATTVSMQRCTNGSGGTLNTSTYVLAPATPGAALVDTDGDGLCDTATDSDDDNDGQEDLLDPSPLDPHHCGDGDGDNCDDCSVGVDGFGPASDILPGNDGTDSDGDGICDVGDGCPNDPNKIGPGVCGCGVADDDSDGDGDEDCIDACPHDADNDIDGDGHCADVDNCPNDANPGQEDADGDEVGDECDGCDADPNKSDPGQCGCGNPDTDTDSDGIADCVDKCPNDPGDDADTDGLCADDDNCPNNANDGQEDADGDLVGDVCDGCPTDPAKGDPGQCGCFVPDTDTDNDGDADCVDACPLDPDNDADTDGLCADMDNCPNNANDGQEDADGDLVGDVCDDCPADGTKTVPGQCGCGNPDTDSDSDGIADCLDLCPNDANKTAPGDCGCDVADSDGDGDGTSDCVDACPNDGDNDIDGDGVCGDADNCPAASNADQADTDGDGLGNACDLCVNDADNDADGDGVCGDSDNCPNASNADQTDGDGDGLGDACDACPADAANDADGDGDCGNADNCPNASNANQADTDGDGQGDACDACPSDAANDADDDGVCGNVDNCPANANADQADTDGDGLGNACDEASQPGAGQQMCGICGAGVGSLMPVMVVGLIWFRRSQRRFVRPDRRSRIA